MKIFKKYKKVLYYKYVEKNPIIKKEYDDYILKCLKNHKRNRLKSWIFLLNLHLNYKNMTKEKEIANNKIETRKNEVKNNDKNNSTNIIFPESEFRKKRTPVQLARKLLEYDIVSFDIFDTLIFRPFNDPVDIFDIIGLKINDPTFKELRIKAEKISRDNSINREVTIYDIYEEMSKLKNIEKDKLINLEIDTELEFCFANSYMKQVFEILKYNNCCIIATSNMYLPKNIILRLLDKCGYMGFDQVFVSCDYKISKGNNGQLFKYISKNYIKNRTVIHVGDNYKMDVENALKSSWEVVHYPNCNVISNKFKIKTEQCLADSIYRGIVATHINNGLMKKSLSYQFGYIYGGILVYGYCEYINDFCKKNQVDKIIWLSRDGYILKKVYEEIYADISNEYFLWSRCAATFLNISTTEDIENLFLRNVYPLLEWLPGATVLDALINIDCVFMESYLFSKYKIRSNDDLSVNMIDKLKEIFVDNKKMISSKLGEKYRETERYIEQNIGTAKNICIIDIGWTGKSILALENYINKNLKHETRVYGVMLGCYNNSIANESIANEKIGTYLFSKYYNKNLYNLFNKNVYNNTLVIESIFSSHTPSFNSYINIDGEEELDFAMPLSENYYYTDELHKGILDFVRDFFAITKEYNQFIKVPPETALTQILHVTTNREWVLKILGDMSFNKISGFLSVIKTQKFKEVYK